MRYISTRDKNCFVSPSQAILKGLADDGGLFVPEAIPSADFSAEDYLSLGYDEMASRLLYKLLPDLGLDSIRSCVSEGYGDKFDSSERVALEKVGERFFLELYHGPTCAFKDMALCVLPRLITASCALNGETRETVILTATSGDTGKAALAGFADVPGTKIIVFYPENGVSKVQKAQMQTQAGSNVYVCAIEGNFDDAQGGVKRAFEEIKTDEVILSSANSINVGRLAPQVAYYFYAYGRLLELTGTRYPLPFPRAISETSSRAGSLSRWDFPSPGFAAPPTRTGCSRTSLKRGPTTGGGSSYSRIPPPWTYWFRAISRD